jgi:hypothetical protein
MFFLLESAKYQTLTFLNETLYKIYGEPEVQNGGKRRAS